MLEQFEKYETLTVGIDGAIATITMNQPETMNAVSPRLHRELEMIWPEVGDLDGVRCIILTGAGEAFTVGGDLRAMERGDFGEYPGATVLPGARDLVNRLLAVRQPIIAAVNGSCVGIGASIALMTDYVVMAEDGRIGDPHVRVGLVAGDGGVAIWPLLLGLNRAKEALLFGTLFTATEAKELGLVNRVVPKEQTLTVAREVAQRIVEAPPLALQWTKLALNKLLKQQVELTFDASAALEMLSFMSQDHKEAIRSFLGKTPPVFKGQ